MEREEFENIAEEEGIKAATKARIKDEWKDLSRSRMPGIALLFIWTYLFIGVPWEAYTLPLLLMIFGIIVNYFVKIAKEDD